MHDGFDNGQSLKSRIVFYTALLLCSLNVWACNQNSAGQKPEKAYIKQQIAKGDLQDDFSLHSDPSDRKMIIIYHSNVAGNGMISIFYEDGKLFGRKQVAMNKGVNNWEYYFPEKTRGMFIIKFTAKNVLRTAKVEKLIY